MLSTGAVWLVHVHGKRVTHVVEKHDWQHENLEESGGAVGWLTLTDLLDHLEAQVKPDGRDL